MKNIAAIRLPQLMIVLSLWLQSQLASGQREVKHETPKTASLATELQNLYKISDLPRYRTESFSAEESTYDRKGGNDDGFAGTYSFIRKTQEGNLVIFDIKGRGVINRIWTPTPTEDSLDFYIDDTSKPALTIRYDDLFSGKKFPFIFPLCGSQLGGNYCYFPILFEKRCMIIARTKKMQFHQIQYRLFADNRMVQSFHAQLSGEEKTALAKVANLWEKEDRDFTDYVEEPAKFQVAEDSFLLEPGETKNIFSLNHGGTIAGLELSPAGAFEGLQKAIDLRITWDDETLPAIDCPVADFFGYAFGKVSMQGLLAGSRNGRDYCFIPMPFDKKAKLELIYRRAPGVSPAMIHVLVHYNSQPRNPQTEGKFYANWKMGKTVDGVAHTLLSTKGQGHYIGTILQAQGQHAGMTYFFEGDDSTVIDGQLRIHGTGSEDYFNGGWYALLDCWDSKMSLPLHGDLEYSLPYSRTGGYRNYLNDKLSFSQSILQTIEHGPSNNDIPAIYTSLALYYCSLPPADIARPEEVQTAVFLPDTLMIYPQLMEYTVDGSVDAKMAWVYPTGGTSCLFTVNDQSLIRVSLKDIAAGSYKLFVDLQSSETGCDFSLYQKQTKRSEWNSTYSNPKKRVPQQYLGDLEVNNIFNSLSLRFKTSSAKKQFFLNRLILVKK